MEWKRVLAKCGLSHRKVHTTRHTFTSMMLAGNVPIAYVSKMLGHTQLKTTQIYLKITDTRIANDMKVLFDEEKEENDSKEAI
jgi:site-specific recombinase XerD